MEVEGGGEDERDVEVERGGERMTRSPIRPSMILKGFNHHTLQSLCPGSCAMTVRASGLRYPFLGMKVWWCLA